MISVATENRRTPTNIGAAVRKIGEVWSVNQPKKETLSIRRSADYLISMQLVHKSRRQPRVSIYCSSILAL